MPASASCACTTCAAVTYCDWLSSVSLISSPLPRPGFGKQLLRALDVALVDRRVRPVAEQPRRHQRIGARHGAVVAGEDHLIDVDRHADRLPHADVVERLLLDVHADPDVVDARLLDDVGVRIVGKRLGAGRIVELGEVQLVGAEGELRGLRLLDRPQHDLRDRRRRARYSPGWRGA